MKRDFYEHSPFLTIGKQKKTLILRTISGEKNNYAKCLNTRYSRLPGTLRFFLCMRKSFWSVQKPRMPRTNLIPVYWFTLYLTALVYSISTTKKLIAFIIYKSIGTINFIFSYCIKWWSSRCVNELGFDFYDHSCLSWTVFNDNILA